MGKQVSKSRKKKSQQSWQTVKNIKKRRLESATSTLITQLTNSIGSEIKLTKKQLGANTSEIISLCIQRRFKTIINDIRYDHQSLLSWAQRFSKVCQICKVWHHHQRLVYCDPCEDGFHMECAQLKNEPGKNWLCGTCKKRRQVHNKQESEREHASKFIIKAAKTQSMCDRCRVFIEKEQRRTSCAKCKQSFHSTCFGGQFFLCSVCLQKANRHLHSDRRLFTLFHDIPNKPKKGSKKHRSQLLLPSYEDKALLLKCKQSLILALETQGITFSDDLVYERVDRSQNSTVKEYMLQKLTEPGYSIFKNFKKMTSSACYGYLIVVYDEQQGFVVKAGEEIAQGTLICEYVGSVYRYGDVVFSKNDSIMTLLQTSEANTTLVILPERFANLAKFLSGINNHERTLKKKQNVASIRMEIDGQARIILYTIKRIKKGETLYYDYNAGGGNNYDTKSFI